MIRKNLSELLHSHNTFKHYNFSNLVLEDKKKSKEGLQFNKAHFFISSPRDKFLKAFVEGLLNYPSLRLGRSKFNIDSIEILDKKDFNNVVEIKTLSPIYIQTKRLKDGNLVSWDLSPEDPKFYENLHKNLIKRYSSFYGKKPNKDHFDVLEVYSHKRRRYKIKNTYRRCSEMHFKLQISKELINFVYDSGLGEKNSMGFGCIEVIDD